jgi:hypothetical protein
MELQCEKRNEMRVTQMESEGEKKSGAERPQFFFFLSLANGPNFENLKKIEIEF